MFSMTKAMGCEWYHSLTGVRILPGQKKLFLILTGLSYLISFTYGSFEDSPTHQKQVAHISNSSTFQNVYWDIGQNKDQFPKAQSTPQWTEASVCLKTAFISPFQDPNCHLCQLSRTALSFSFFLFMFLSLFLCFLNIFHFPIRVIGKRMYQLNISKYLILVINRMACSLNLLNF